MDAESGRVVCVVETAVRMAIARSNYKKSWHVNRKPISGTA